MEIAERTVGQVSILDVSGRITLTQDHAFLKTKINSMIESGQTRVLVNLAEVSYIDSAGLGELLRAFTTIREAGGSLKLENASKRMHDLLSATKLLTVFQVFDSEPAAISSFS